MVRRGEIALSLGLAVPQGKGVPTFKVDFYWNGNFIGRNELNSPSQIVEITVPAEYTCLGRNRLEIIPNFWVNANRLAGGSSASNVSVELFNLTIARLPGSEELARSAQLPRATDQGIEQRANTLVTFFEQMPRKGFLLVDGRWMDDIPAANAKATLVMKLNTGEVIEIASFSRDVKDPGSRAFDLSQISDSELTFAEISLIVEQAGSEEAKPVLFEWNKLAFEAPNDRDSSIRSLETSAALRPNVILYVIDTLRASHLEPFGNSKAATPNFISLAENATICLSATAHTSWTRPSVVTLLTSLYETTHGTSTLEHSLARSLPYLPQILQDAGYLTAAISMNGHIAPQWGFARGFDSFDRISEERAELLTPPEPRAYVGKLWDRYIAPAIAVKSSPFFLYLHELDPHGPYTPPAPFDDMYPSHYRGYPEVEAEHIALVRTQLTELKPEDIEFLELRYRGEVSFVDAVVGEMIKRLESEGLKENTIIIIVSDHGEEFGEHGGIGHSVTLYEEVLHIPMLWMWPGHVVAGHRTNAQVGLIDVAPTLLSLLGMDIPSSMQGQDISAMLFGNPYESEPRQIFSHKSDIPGRARQAVRVGPWKLIERIGKASSTFELFNIEDEPAEITNRWIGEPIVGGALRQAIAWQRYTSGQVASVDKVEIETLDPEMVEQLRNLGYVE